MTAWNEFGKIGSAKGLKEYFSDINQYRNKRRQFYHYSSLNAIEKIVDMQNPYFRLKSIAAQNDQTQPGAKDDERTFTLCFSSGTHENLSLWMIYADKEKKGVGCVSPDLC